MQDSPVPSSFGRLLLLAAVAVSATACEESPTAPAPAEPSATNPVSLIGGTPMAVTSVTLTSGDDGPGCGTETLQAFDTTSSTSLQSLEEGDGCCDLDDATGVRGEECEELESGAELEYPDYITVASAQSFETDCNEFLQSTGQCTPREPNESEQVLIQTALGILNQRCGIGTAAGQLNIMVWDDRALSPSGNVVYGSLDPGTAYLWTGDGAQGDEYDKVDWVRTIAHEYFHSIYGSDHDDPRLIAGMRDCGYAAE